MPNPRNISLTYDQINNTSYSLTHQTGGGGSPSFTYKFTFGNVIRTPTGIQIDNISVQVSKSHRSWYGPPGYARITYPFPQNETIEDVGYFYGNINSSNVISNYGSTSAWYNRVYKITTNYGFYVKPSTNNYELILTQSNPTGNITLQNAIHVYTGNGISVPNNRENWYLIRNVANSSINYNLDTTSSESLADYGIDVNTISATSGYGNAKAKDTTVSNGGPVFQNKYNKFVQLWDRHFFGYDENHTGNDQTGIISLSQNSIFVPMDYTSTQCIFQIRLLSHTTSGVWFLDNLQFTISDVPKPAGITDVSINSIGLNSCTVTFSPESTTIDPLYVKYTLRKTSETSGVEYDTPIDAAHQWSIDISNLNQDTEYSIENIEYNTSDIETGWIKCEGVSAQFRTLSGCKIYNNGWKNATPYIYKNGWKKVKSIYCFYNNQWNKVYGETIPVTLQRTTKRGRPKKVIDE